MILYGCTAYFSWYFNPRPPRGGRLNSFYKNFRKASISIHAPREGGDVKIGQNFSIISIISIHAPREGGDLYVFAPGPSSHKISIHAPREGGDMMVRVISMKICF